MPVLRFMVEKLCHVFRKLIIPRLDPAVASPSFVQLRFWDGCEISGDLKQDGTRNGDVDQTKKYDRQNSQEKSSQDHTRSHYDERQA